MHNKLKKFTLNFLESHVKKINTILNSGKMKILSKNETKFDPVTSVDVNINKLIINKIKKSFSNHSIISEEVDNIYIKSSNYKWFIDPIDGTKNLILGLKYYAVLIGLYYKNKPIYSLIFYPSLNEVYFSIVNQSFYVNTLNNKIIKIKNLKNRIKKIKILKVISNTKNTLKSKKISDFLSDDQILFKITGADSMNYILLATNRIDIVIEDGLKNIDILPLMNFLQINNVDFINWDNNKQIFKSNNSLIFFKKNKKNTIFVKKFLNLFKS